MPAAILLKAEARLSVLTCMPELKKSALASLAPFTASTTRKGTHSQGGCAPDIAHAVKTFSDVS